MYINNSWQKAMEGMGAAHDGGIAEMKVEAMRGTSLRYTFSRIQSGMVCHVISPTGRILALLGVEDGPPDYPAASDRFDFGNATKESAQTALVLIRAITKSDVLAIRWHQELVKDCIAKFQGGQCYTIHGCDIANYVAHRERELTVEATKG